MWHEGLTLALGGWSLNAAALLFGAYLGLRGLFDARAVGNAEFRAASGGFLLAVHAIAFFFSAEYIWGGAITIGAFAAGAAAVLAAAWAGAAAGRGLAMWRNKTPTRANAVSAGIACAMAALIASPWLAWALSPPG